MICIIISLLEGMINAAKMFEFPDLHAACWEFALECMRPDTLPLVVEGATMYSQFKETRQLMQKVCILLFMPNNDIKID